MQLCFPYPSPTTATILQTWEAVPSSASNWEEVYTYLISYSTRAELLQLHDKTLHMNYENSPQFHIGCCEFNATIKSVAKMQITYLFLIFAAMHC